MFTETLLLQKETWQPQNFLQAKTKILIATDVFSRGMDVPQVNLIINFDMPTDKGGSLKEVYVHRIGRSGRFDRRGFVIDFISGGDDMRVLSEVQGFIDATSGLLTIDTLSEAFANEDA